MIGKIVLIKCEIRLYLMINNQSFRLKNFILLKFNKRIITFKFNLFLIKI